jgi:predicted amidohydrolase
VKVAAYQAPLLPIGSMEALARIRDRIGQCEAAGVSILCCPEAILGGLADYAEQPDACALSRAELDAMLAPLASDTVTTIVGFTERGSEGRLHNSAAVYHNGSILGVYRKLYPAINTSVYEPGCETPVFRAGLLTFGIVICNDSNYVEPARLMAAHGATALFVPTNNGLPSARAPVDLVGQARNADIARAVENTTWIIRADVAGGNGTLESQGSSAIVDRHGTVVAVARTMSEDLLVAEIDPAPRASRRGWDASRNRAVMEAYAAYVSGL